MKGDRRDGMRPGSKFYEWELKGVPVRLELGPRDLAAGQVVAARRMTPEGKQAKQPLRIDSLASTIPALLEEIQADLYDAARARLAANTRPVNSYEEFKSVLDAQGGFLQAHWCGSPECEARIKEETKATIRCIPLVSPPEMSDTGACLICGGVSSRRVYFARAY